MLVFKVTRVIVGPSPVRLIVFIDLWVALQPVLLICIIEEALSRDVILLTEDKSLLCIIYVV